MENYIVTQSRLHNLSNDYLVITFELANNTESCDCSLSHCLIRQDHGFSSPHELHQLPGWLGCSWFTRTTGCQCRGVQILRDVEVHRKLS